MCRPRPDYPQLAASFVEGVLDPIQVHAPSAARVGSCHQSSDPDPSWKFAAQTFEEQVLLYYSSPYFTFELLIANVVVRLGFSIVGRQFLVRD